MRKINLWKGETKDMDEMVQKAGLSPFVSLRYLELDGSPVAVVSSTSMRMKQILTGSVHPVDIDAIYEHCEKLWYISSWISDSQFIGAPLVEVTKRVYGAELPQHKCSLNREEGCEYVG